MLNVFADSRKAERHNSIYIGSGILFLFLTMFFPDSFKWLRFLLFVVLFVFALLDIIANNIPLGEGINVLFFFLAYNGFAFILGLLGGAPGAWRSQSVDLLWPVLFYLIGMTLNSEHDYMCLQKYMILFTIILSAFDCWYCLGNLGFLPFPIFFETLNLNLIFGNYGTFIQYTSTHQATLIFMIPFTVTLLFDLKKTSKYIKPFWVLMALLLEFACLLMSGRVALQVIAALSLVIVIAFRSRLNRIKRKKHSLKRKTIVPSFLLVFLVFPAIIIIMSRMLSLDIGKIWDYIASKFTSSTSASENVRLLQFNALMNGWLSAPIFGHGTGSYTPGSSGRLLISHGLTS